MDTLNISRSTKNEFDVNEVLRLSSKICEDCKTKDCCRMSDPVFLTDLDIKKIKSNLEIQETEFVDQILYEGKIFRRLKLKNNGECTFFCDETQRCKIYKFRPMDCQLFPLDIDKNGKYRWIEYNICQLSTVFSKERLEIAKEQILPILRKDIEEYAVEDMKIYNEGKLVVHENVDLRSDCK